MVRDSNGIFYGGLLCRCYARSSNNGERAAHYITLHTIFTKYMYVLGCTTPEWWGNSAKQEGERQPSGANSQSIVNEVRVMAISLKLCRVGAEWQRQEPWDSFSISRIVVRKSVPANR